MALDLLKKNCDVAMPNTGEPSCDISIGVLKGVIFATEQKQYDREQTIDALITAMQADVLNASPSARLYPYFGFMELTADNTQERSKIQKGTQGAIFGEAKSRDFRYECADMDYKFFAKMVKLNKLGKLYFFGVDAKGNLLGAKGTGNTIIPIKLAAQCLHEKKFNTDTTTNIYFDMITEDPYAFGANLAVVDMTGYDITTQISGLYDVTLAATPSALKIRVTGTVDVSDVDFMELYAGEADVAGAYVVTNAAGAAVTPSAVASVAGDPYSMDLTVVAGTYSVKLANPTALAALSIGSASQGGYESNTVTGLVVPAT